MTPDCLRRRVIHGKPTRARGIRPFLLLSAWMLAGRLANPSQATETTAAIPPLDLIRQAEAARAEVVARVAPAVVCIFESTQSGGGSGVLVDAAGYGVTNYHVVAELGNDRRGWGGLSDGKLYELEVLGIDPGGDLAAFRLRGRDDFPFATWGDSAAVHVGDTVLAMGNPFSLSEDYTPSVSLGMITGVGRYQWGVAGNLTYSDCLQFDAPINPGNSGGPLFDSTGRIIGINGRISINVRGRYNVGFGYAISSEQVLRFLPGLRAGHVVPHGTLQARVEDGPDGVVFSQLLPGGPAESAGIQAGDRLVAIDDEPIPTANRFASVMGTYPGSWLTCITINRSGQVLHALARLDDLPVKLPQPYGLDAEANRREALRVLKAFRAAAGMEWHDSLTGSLRWNIEREYASEEPGKSTRIERFQARMEDQGPALIEDVAIDGASPRRTSFDALTAEWRRGDEERAFAFTPDVRVTLGGLYVLLRLYRDDPALKLPDGLAHAGGDAHFTPLATDGPAVSMKPTENGCAAPRVVEILSVPIGERCAARLAFDQVTHLPQRLNVRDELNGVSVTLFIAELKEFDGRLLPAVIQVSGPGYSYRERWDSWRLEP